MHLVSRPGFIVILRRNGYPDLKHCSASPWTFTTTCNCSDRWFETATFFNQTWRQAQYILALVSEAGAGGATAPPKVLIWWKSGPNPLKSGQNLREPSKTHWKSEQQWRPNWYEELFFGGHFFEAIFGQVWESPGKFPSHPQNFACSYTYASLLLLLQFSALWCSSGCGVARIRKFLSGVGFFIWLQKSK